MQTVRAFSLTNDPTPNETSFEEFLSIETLSLRYNHIHTIENHAFTNLYKLKVLYLSYNCLLALSECSFCGLTDLESLFLDYTQTEYIDINKLKPGVMLSLKGNNITNTIFFHTFDRLSRYEYTLEGRSS